MSVLVKELKSQQRVIQGMRISFYEAGHTSPVILIHGAGENAKIWSHIINNPPTFNRFIAVDLPGHGISEKPTDGVTIDFYASIISDFVEEIGLDKPVLVGHSMGGAIAQVLGVRKQDSWRGIVLAHTGAKLGVLPEILDRIGRETRLTIRENILPLGLPPGYPSELANKLEEMMMKNSKEIIAQDYIACNRFDIRHLIHRIKVPTLILAGVHDRLTPLKWAIFLKSKITKSRLIVIGGCGHFSMIERPVEFHAALRSYLASLDRGA